MRHFLSQIYSHLVQIDTKFYGHSMLFIQILFVYHAGTWHGFWTSSSHAIFMPFAKKMMGFPSNLVSFLNILPLKRHDKIRITFFTGSFFIVIFLPIVVYFLTILWLNPRFLQLEKLVFPHGTKKNHNYGKVEERAEPVCPTCKPCNCTGREKENREK